MTPCPFCGEWVETIDGNCCNCDKDLFPDPRVPILLAKKRKELAISEPQPMSRAAVRMFERDLYKLKELGLADRQTDVELNLIAAIHALETDFDIMDEALIVSERDNERLTWQFNILHDALSEIAHGAENPREVADAAFSKIAKGERGDE